MSANYNKIAPVYDFLSRMVFGKAIINAQVSLLKCLPAGNYRLLIVGGGTGWILEELAKQRPEGLTIDYVEASGEMIALSRKRRCGINTVNFIHAPVENFENNFLYRVVITPFVFDNFEAPKAEMVFGLLNKMLAENGMWLHADFVYDKSNSPFWQKGLLDVMYFFFRITTKIEAGKLISMDKYFEDAYAKKAEAWFYFRFIKATVYTRL